MLRHVRDFFQKETGAVTVDWVVLTAGIVGLAMAVIYPIMTSSVSWAESLAELVRTNTYDK